MNSEMDRHLHQQSVQRALELGRGANPAALPELIDLLALPSTEIRRLAASAIGKLAGFGAEATIAAQALAPIALRDPHPQVQQYALKALKCYGAAARTHLPDLDDLACNEQAKDYVRRAAHSAAEAIREAVRLAEAGARHRCARCGREVSPEEHARSRQAFQRTFCDACFDEVFLDRRNFDAKVELNKTIVAKAGTLVQSSGERLIADWLAAHNIAFRYDERFRILSGHAVRPDFYLPELDLYIEYWGMDTADYKIGMLKKQQLYQQEGKRLVSIYPDDKPRLDSILRAKLTLFGFHVPPPAVGERAMVGPESGETQGRRVGPAPGVGERARVRPASPDFS
ncbi:MAG: HEAT repeat domain-containing protein [Verrucomicrobia bacterium]|nr:HEAT repeat domain-containing protein [Verrucomicrobiota bacterium]